MAPADKLVAEQQILTAEEWDPTCKDIGGSYVVFICFWQSGP